MNCCESDSLRERFHRVRGEMAEALIERQGEIDLVLTALLAQENVLLVGPPGCAKSLLLDSLASWCRGNRFCLLLTRFTTPEEVLGPISLSGLKRDVFRRVTTGKLPEADLCFLDEIFKASSAILNVLLKLLNERTYEVGDGTSVKVPLKLCLAAGNEWPSAETSKELAALFDRFALRKSVRPIASASGRQRLLWQDDHHPKLSGFITPPEIDQASEQARQLPWSPEAKEALETILRELRQEGIVPGDRRQVKAVKIARAFAWLEGATCVEPEHLEPLADVLWDSPEEQPQKTAQIVARIANPTGMKLNQLLLECEEILAGSDLRQLAQAASATTKLGEIDRQFALLPKHDRVERARQYVREQIRTIKLASIEAL